MRILLLPLLLLSLPCFAQQGPQKKCFPVQVAQLNEKCYNKYLRHYYGLCTNLQLKSWGRKCPVRTFAIHTEPTIVKDYNLYPLGTRYYHHNTTHPYMLQTGMANSMHDDYRASDANLQTGPVPPAGATATYFYTKPGGGYYPGLCASFAFIDSSHFITISFGRRYTTLLLVDNDSLKVLDYLVLPGRKMKIKNLMNKEKRKKVFTNCSGGAYFFIAANKNIYIPSSDNRIYVVTVATNNRTFNKSSISQVFTDSILDNVRLLPDNKNKTDDFNKLTAIMPDTRGNLWFVTRSGFVGAIIAKQSAMVHDRGMYDMCTYNVNSDNTSQLAVYKLLPRVERDAITGAVDAVGKYPDAKAAMIQLRDRVISLTDSIDQVKEFKEEIENSFCTDLSGHVYVASNFAVYKFEYDPLSHQVNSLWADSLYRDTRYYKTDPVTFSNKTGLIGPAYCNVGFKKSGQINAGTGTTPTYIPGIGIAYMDNSAPYMNLVVQDEQTGLKAKFFSIMRDGVIDTGFVQSYYSFIDLQHFRHFSSCENSVACYDSFICVGNTLGYDDPFHDQSTTGGISKLYVKDTFRTKGTLYIGYYFDSNCYSNKDSSGCRNFHFSQTDSIDAKTATPKISIGSGLYYYYNQYKYRLHGGNTLTNGSWQLTAFSLHDNREVFHIPLNMDNHTYLCKIGFATKFLCSASGVCGRQAQEKYLLNNLWATFTFGPDRSVLVATSKGFIKIKSP